MVLQWKEKFFIHGLRITRRGETQYFQLRVPQGCKSLIQVLVTTTAYRADAPGYRVGELTLKAEEIFFQGEVEGYPGRLDAYASQPVWVNEQSPYLFGFYRDGFLQDSTPGQSYRVKLYFRYGEKLQTPAETTNV